MPRLVFFRCAERLIAAWLIAAIMFAVGASAATAGQTASGQDLGSTHDYMQTNPGPYGQGDPSPPMRFLSWASQCEARRSGWNTAGPGE
jgi:hypothetical protein